MSLPTKVCANHQPNFFPWLGYFDKIDRADVFVFLNNVQFVQRSWTSRVKVEINQAPQWLTCHVKGSRKPIKDIEISDDHSWRESALRTLQMNYAKCAGFSKGMEFLAELILSPVTNLSEFNINCITRVSEALGLKCEFIRQTELNTQLDSTHLMIEICKKTGCPAYLNGGGADGYLEPDLFSNSGVELIQQNFQHPQYGIEANMIPGLSIIDFLMKTEDWRNEWKMIRTLR